VRNKVEEVALKHGMISLPDTSGTNIDVQIFDTAKIKWAKSSFPQAKLRKEPVLIVMDYAFGEQAYETIDELLKPFKKDILLNVESVSIMGKQGILEGGKGDIMIPNAHINEGTADNYFFRKRIKCSNV
jgi:deoxyhypusine synthase